MTDYISRQAAIEAIRGCTEYYHNNMPTMIDKASAQTELMMLPDAHVVEIVRCKDCKHLDKGENDSESWCECTRIFGTYFDVSEDDFCSYGERAEE